LHYEFFNAGPVNIEGYRAFEVQLASSGRIVVVPPGQTVVQALLAAGVEIPTSCEQGVCGTSITRGTSKKARSPQRPFHAREHSANDQFTPCCSRAKSARLVLDL
jgi:vanillate monooxygenase ferredoxin subunit